MNWKILDEKIDENMISDMNDELEISRNNELENKEKMNWIMNW